MVAGTGATGEALASVGAGVVGVVGLALRFSASELRGAATGASLSKSELRDSCDLRVVRTMEFTMNATARTVVSFVMKLPLAELEKTA